MKTLDLQTAREILDLSGGQEDLKLLGEIQLEGAVALFNMIADPDLGVGYLADEVGMGKTYIALSVVALMRYFNPSLRVLYICPSRNVQEKWDREYRSFIRHNVKVSQNRIRTLDGEPAAPYISCKNVVEMIEVAASGYYADFFVGKDNFSISLQDDPTEDMREWVRKCKDISKLLPAHQWQAILDQKVSGLSKDQVKDEVKFQYASALNYVLPTFDLVVIDEAHNFKHNLESSARNKVLSRVLGFNDQDNYRPRVKHSLLLSATPYDRDINQLRNQLNLVGKKSLISEGVKDTEGIKNTLKRFMVRRLNTLSINGKDHTRNMYRIEHRKAEISLGSAEQKLVTALVQKKVGDLMNQKGSSPSFQTGMLSSFESYAQTSKIDTVKFDGDETEKKNKDAEDRHIIDHIIESYKKAGLGLTLPHPKMDSVCEDLKEKVFNHSKKQIIFVRRVRSVKEIKDKLDEAYNVWLKEYIHHYLKGHPDQKVIFQNLFEEYKNQSEEKDADISEGIYREGSGEGDQEDNQPPKNDTFFSWFFRGAPADNVNDILSIDNKTLITPEAVRRGLSAKNQQVSLMFEVNWAYRICKQHDQNLNELVSQYSDEILLKAQKYHTDLLVDDYQDVFRACQLGFIEWYSEHFQNNHYLKIIEFFKPSKLNQSKKVFSQEDLSENLQLITFFTEIHRAGIEANIFMVFKDLLDSLKDKKNDLNYEDQLQKMNIHWHLISLCLRTGHGVIDLYLSRIKLRADDLNKRRRTQWVVDLVANIKKQTDSESFSTFKELSLTSEQLDLIIKNNIADIPRVSLESRRKVLSQRLNPVAPVIGATGETYSSRSAQARKFRMPGYPLALVTTDVLQEGEDLHTFCDSVLHYGITGSPISIEQKTGRVDRVYSMAQRRLKQIQSENVEDDDLIQVSFPHIKESIEFLQVRQLCLNLNEFTNSLHDIGIEQVGGQDEVNTEEALKDRSDIPEQIKRFLKSPFVPEVPDETDITTQVIGTIEQASEHIQQVTSHINNLIKKHGQNTAEFIDDHLKVKISSTRGTGETLIVGEMEFGEFHLRNDDLNKMMREQSWQTFYRIQAEKMGTDLYKLFKNSEMLIGDEHVTQDEDIQHFFNSFSDAHNPQYLPLTSEKIKDYCERAQRKGVSLRNLTPTVSVKYINNDGRHALEFEFGDEQLQRKHIVNIFEGDGFCILISKAVSEFKINAYGKNKSKVIIENTWIRNKRVDLVEFLLDPEGGISGRVIHPISSMDWEEFIFCAYVLSVETDRLEYLFDHQDVF